MMEWQPISTADKKAPAVFCDHQEWDLPMWCWWGENVRGHIGGRWYQIGELEWLEPQPEVWLLLPPRVKPDA